MARRRQTEEVAAAEKVAYRKVECGLWMDDKFLSFAGPQPNPQSLWIYLLIGPRTTVLPGLVCAREAVIADDLKWSLDGTRDAIRDVTRAGMLDADWDAGVVVLRKALFDSLGRPRDSSKPQSIGQLKGWAKHFRFVRECQLKYEYLLRLEAMAIAMGDAWEDAMRDAFREALAMASRMPPRIQITDNRQQTTVREELRDVRRTLEFELSAQESTAPKSDHAAVVAAFDARYSEAYGASPTWNKTRGAQVRALLKSHQASEVVRRIDVLFTSPPAWLKGPHDFGTLVQHFDKLAQPATAEPTLIKEL